MIKVAAPNSCAKVVDWAIQAFGAAGFSQDTPLSLFYAYARHLRTADGPRRSPSQCHRPSGTAALSRKSSRLNFRGKQSEALLSERDFARLGAPRRLRP
jgi:hypothetical protein